MKNIIGIILTSIVLLFSCGKGEVLEYPEDVCKIVSHHKDWSSVDREETEFKLSFGLNSYTSLRRVYMDTCHLEGVTIDHTSAKFTWNENEIDYLSCDKDGYITGDTTAAVVQFDLKYDGPTNYGKFVFILDNEESSDTINFTVRI